MKMLRLTMRQKTGSRERSWKTTLVLEKPPERLRTMIEAPTGLREHLSKTKKWSCTRQSLLDIRHRKSHLQSRNIHTANSKVQRKRSRRSGLPLWDHTHQQGKWMRELMKRAGCCWKPLLMRL